MRTPLALLCVAAALAACSVQPVTYTPDEGPREDCNAPGDEDGNGLADCADPACAAAPACQPRCGDGKLDADEQCDDGPDNGAHRRCTAACRLNVCGDGDPLIGVEQCDGGAGGVARDSASCDADCTLALCGDGHVNAPAGEACDDGASNGKPGDPCSATCQLVSCGNGSLEQGEQCDDGADNAPGARCTASCRFNVCGDGAALVGVEQCDGGAGGVRADTATCDDDCTLAVCGDGHLNPLAGEGCDDGPRNGQPGDPCSITCHLVSCGNGSLEQGEECDDGPGNGAGKRCNASCKFNVCGDGDALVGVEQCDGGAGGVRQDTAICDADCTFAVCGDSRVNRAAGEACDDGARNGTLISTCDAFCQLVACGNGIVEQGEQCDAGLGGVPQDTAACDTDCTVALCGDGHRNLAAGEACDDGDRNGTASSTCNAFCRPVLCGNGVIELAEQCDDGPGNNGAGKRCNASCKFNVCGDGDALIGAEQCDGGPGDTSTCDADCTFAVCGDGHVNAAAGEACDDGPLNGTLASPHNCNSFCHVTACGNGVVEPGEDCDNGTNDTATCDRDCTIAVCGDGYVNLAAGEQCDDGPRNGTPGDPCNASCRIPGCGNGLVEPGEDCDSGGLDTPFCDADCTAPTCGDGHVNPVAGEVCEDGNQSACGTCNASCTVAVTPTRSTGAIVAPAGSDLLILDSFTLGDGIGAPVTFQFVGNVPPIGHQIRFAPTDSPAVIATRIATAINTSGLQVSAGLNADGVSLVVVNRLLGAAGNVSILSQVATPTFQVSGMSGGRAADCPAGVGCAIDDDCLSHVCANHLCQ